MFGMTKKQFVKKSKNCLKDTGVELLIIREIFSKEKTGKFAEYEAYKQLENVRKNMEDIFFKYESLKPPVKCKALHRKILNSLIIIQEAVVLNTEYLLLIQEGSEELAQEKYKKSFNELEKFRDRFRELSQELDVYLARR
ncbi:MAG: hypothetical protein HVN35_09060 [Methanobacteriaceae archaeon]|nr:hypothetical protein [Methanobacteriaceae archaeon]